MAAPFAHPPTRLTASSTLVCKPGGGPLAVPAICLLRPNVETFDMSSRLRHRSLQHTAGQSLKVHVTCRETYTSSKARYLLQLSPSTFTPTSATTPVLTLRRRSARVGGQARERPCLIKPKGHLPNIDVKMLLHLLFFSFCNDSR